jgi:hypothetical protein
MPAAKFFEVFVRSPIVEYVKAGLTDEFRGRAKRAATLERRALESVAALFLAKALLAYIIVEDLPFSVR